METKDDTPSYVTYGMLHKNHEFVDWVRVDILEDEKTYVQNANSNVSNPQSKQGDCFRAMDERAFDKFKTQWQEISAADASPPTEGSKAAKTVKDSIDYGKKLIAIASAKTLTPDKVAFGVFDADWNLVKLSPRYSKVDMAILLHAAKEEGKNETETGARPRMRTYLTEPKAGSDGNLPEVPVRRSLHQQFLIKQSVQLFFSKNSIEFFAASPLRYSPRTIYRFDMVNGGIDRVFWQQVKYNQSQRSLEGKTSMNDKLIELQSKISSNTADLQNKLANNTAELRNSLSNASKGPLLSFRNRKSLFGSKEHVIKEAEDESKDEEPKTEISTVTDNFTFTIDGGDDDDESGTPTLVTESTPSSTSSSPVDGASPAGYVALTIDDVPCRFDDKSHSQLENVLDLLKKYDSKATFMVISDFATETHEPDMIRLLVEGHELANHGVRDEAMDKMATSVETFVEAVEECNSKIKNLQEKAKATADVEVGVKWFRAPQAKYTKIMEEGLEKLDMYNVMCDAYAACPIVEDGPWIATALSKQIHNGSIACLHMPEKCGFREYCLEALENLLEDLVKKRNFKVVTVGELHKLAEEVAARPPEERKESSTMEKPQVSNKLSEMRSKMTSNAANMRTSLLKLKRNSNRSLSIKSSESMESDSSNPSKKELMATKLSQMKLRMSENSLSMRNSLASKVSKRTSGSLLQTNQKTSGDLEGREDEPSTETPTSTMPDKLNQMKLRMSENTNQMKVRMSENTSQMKLRMSENTNQMKLRMSENTINMRTKFASKMAGSKFSLFKKNKKNQDETSIDTIDFQGADDTLL